MSDIETPPSADEGDFNLTSISPSVRRGRGRPRKDQSYASGNSQAGGEHKEPNEPKPRKRKRGSASTDEITARATVLAGIHATLSFFMQAPEVMLTQDQAYALASASLNVENELGFEINTKAVAIVTLIGTAAQIYIPKAIMVRQRMARQQEADKRQSETEFSNDAANNAPNLNPMAGTADFRSAA